MRRALTLPRKSRRRWGGAAFTLIELLAVIALIAILASIGLNLAASAHQGAERDAARAELAVLQGALEDYRRVFKSYPITESGTGLLRALAGKAGPDGTPVVRRPFIALTALRLQDENPAAEGNVIVDPWGAAYVYRAYVDHGRPRFYLYSIGPDGRDRPPGTDGILDPDAADNLDNLYAHP